MKIKLWLLRHGQAGPYVRFADHLRELTERGRCEALSAAVHLRTEPLDVLLVSPYLRAQQTAALVHGQLESAPPLITFEGITPDDNPLQALTRLAARDEANILVVSHQPLLGLLAGLLVHGHLQEPVPFDTASLALLEGDLLLAGGMTLTALHHVSIA